ncbi:MAG TPA: glycosyltransferase [Candidatus Bipolaricaulota bacterium]|nr:glycosyltransferase [Candidatus Bipolaricaulota bacterium]
MKNIIAIPPYYLGTSFEDIVRGLKLSIKHIGIKATMVGYIKPLDNCIKGGILDDSDYITGQFKLIEKLIALGKVDRILFLDFFNPGIDLLKYYYTQQGIICRLGALLHGGSFLPNDLYSWPWLKKTEFAWASIYDRIYVPSRFLAEECPQDFCKKIKVSPWGMDAFRKCLLSHKIKYDVIFPHRLDDDKGIEQFCCIVSKLPAVGFVVTFPQPMNIMRKNKYFKMLQRYKNIIFIAEQSSTEHIQTLAQSRIVLSCSKQENFGYAVMKAVACGCIPVLPNNLCYPDFFPERFLYTTSKEAIYLISHYIKDCNNKNIEHELVDRVKKYSFVPILKDFFQL